MRRPTMNKCICDQCANLKPVIDDESGKVEQYECEFDFPSEDCLECEQDGCDHTCDNYISREEEKEFLIKCQECGKELKQHGRNQEEGKVFCIECFLKNN